MYNIDRTWNIVIFKWNLKNIDVVLLRPTLQILNNSNFLNSPFFKQRLAYMVIWDIHPLYRGKNWSLQANYCHRILIPLQSLYTEYKQFFGRGFGLRYDLLVPKSKKCGLNRQNNGIYVGNIIRGYSGSVWTMSCHKMKNPLCMKSVNLILNNSVWTPANQVTPIDDKLWRTVWYIILQSVGRYTGTHKCFSPSFGHFCKPNVHFFDICLALDITDIN